MTVVADLDVNGVVVAYVDGQIGGLSPLILGDGSFRDEVGAGRIGVNADPSRIVVVPYAHSKSAAGKIRCGDLGSGRVDRHREHDLAALVLIGSEAGMIEIMIELEYDMRVLRKVPWSP